MNEALIVFARLPLLHIPAKTTLGQEIQNPSLAAVFGHALTRKVLNDFSHFEGQKFFCFGAAEKCTEDQIQPCQETYSDWNFFPQAIGKDVRGMQEAFTHVFDQEYQKVILIGTDIVGLDLTKIRYLFELLDNVDICLQPLEDNGYGAIGMRKNIDVFSEIQNFDSRSEGYNLVQETRELCKKKDIILQLPKEKCFDIDTKQDLKRLLAMKPFWQHPEMKDLETGLCQTIDI